MTAAAHQFARKPLPRGTAAPGLDLKKIRSDFPILAAADSRQASGLS